MAMSPRQAAHKNATRLRAVVHGRVQGVNFRYYTQQRAEELGLAGWVANRPEGTVEVVAEGAPSRLGDFLAFLQTGPSLARVDQVDIHWETATGEFNGFRTRYL